MRKRKARVCDVTRREEEEEGEITLVEFSSFNAQRAMRTDETRENGNDCIPTPLGLIDS